MTQPERGDSANPLSSIILVLVMAVGALWVQTVSLPSARPPESQVAQENYTAQQNIDARLWQDPFEAERKNAPKPAKDAGPSIQGTRESRTPEGLSGTEKQNTICSAKSSSRGVQVMAVMVSGAPYAEAAENRRRARYAVISGLARQEYVPADREHIGSINANLTGSFADASGKNQSMDIPFEWFNHAIREDVLVLWIDETRIRDQPVHGLEQIVSQACSCVGDRETVVIGPSSSDTLRAMVVEVRDAFENRNKPKATKTTDILAFLQGTRIFSPMATAPDDELLQVIPGTPAGDTIKANLESWVPPDKFGKRRFRFQRTIATDTALVRSLVRELVIRRVKPDDGIVLISEWDTSYGRALSKTFKTKIEAERKKQGLFVDPKEEHLWQYSYLRGLDGMLPGEGTEKKTDENKNARENDSTSVEAPFGNHQKDYLRRIAARVADLDQRLKKGEKKTSVKAIGILGSDVYDKLLILRALRPRFPAAVYFTTDLDARLLHAEEWASARNLVVASGYGLRLNGWLQQEIPPFRDSYQTSYFLSVQAALLNDGDLDKAMNKLESSTPRIFEIGRSQPVDLSVTETDEVKCNLASCNSPHPHAGPPAYLPWKPYLFATVLLLLAIWYWNRRTVTYLRVKARASIAASLRYPGSSYGRARFLGFSPAVKPDPWYCRVLRLLVNKWIVGLFFALLLVSWLAWQVSRVYHDIFIVGPAFGEPFSWYEGVSIWPSVFLRAGTGLLALYLFLRGMQRLRKSDVQTTRRLFYGHARTLLGYKRARPCLGLHIWHALVREQFCRCVLSGRLWRWFKGEQRQFSKAIFIWRDTLQPRSRVALIGRVTVGTALLVAIVLILWGILPSEVPNTPSRGELSYQVNRCVLFFALLSFAFLLVFVIDSIRRTCRLALRLSRPTRWPANLEREFGHDNSRHCDDWLDIQLIATRTAVVGEFIYYPFVIISLLILARSSIFDNWQISANLWFIFIFYLSVSSIACAMSLRKAAERARAHALANLTRYIITGEGREEPGKNLAQLKLMKEAILAERRGAFSSFMHQPWLKAALLPLGSFSGIQLIEYLSLLSL